MADDVNNERQPMQADIAQIISNGWKSGKGPHAVAEEILREFDVPAALAATPAVVVPKEPTPEMLVAGRMADEDCDMPGQVYRAMIAAAPAHTATPTVGGEVASIRQYVKNARGAIESGQVTDKDVHGTLTKVIAMLDALAAPPASPLRGRVSSRDIAKLMDKHGFSPAARPKFWIELEQVLNRDAAAGSEAP